MTLQFLASILSRWNLLIKVIGYLVVFAILARFVVWVIAMTRKIDLSAYRHRDGAWALITGATDGIGLGFAQELLAHGFNVIIVGRNPEKLESVKSALLAEFPKQKVEVACSEASDTSDANIQSIIDKVGSLPVTVLVNNVGMGQGNKFGLDKLEPELIRKLINVNCTFPTLLTQAVLQSLVRRRERALVINVASVAGLLVNPFHGLYGASKAFNHSLSLSMSMEYPNIDVLSVCPGFVATNMTRLKPNFFVPSGRECARLSLKRIGDISCLPHWMHVITYVLPKIPSALPERWSVSTWTHYLKPHFDKHLKSRLFLSQ